MLPKSPPLCPSERFWRAALASLAAVALVLLVSPTPGAYARWSQTLLMANGNFSTGELSMTRDGGFVRLWSRQPVGSRTYISSATSCPTTAGSAGSDYRECRQFTWDSFANEELVPGDQVEFVQPLTVHVDGTRLTAQLAVVGTVSLGGLTGSGTTARSWVALPETTSSALAVQLGPGRNQKWWARTTVNIPPTNAGAAWGTGLRGASFTPHLKITLGQTFAGGPG